jgi:hypothetical protein
MAAVPADYGQIHAVARLHGGRDCTKGLTTPEIESHKSNGRRLSSKFDGRVPIPARFQRILKIISST